MPANITSQKIYTQVLFSSFSHLYRLYNYSFCSSLSPYCTVWVSSSSASASSITHMASTSSSTRSALTSPRMALAGTPIQAHSTSVQVFDPWTVELLDGRCSENAGYYSMGCLPSLLAPSSSSSSSFMLGAVSTPLHEAHLKSIASDCWAYSGNTSVVSFGQGCRTPRLDDHKNAKHDQEEGYDSWIDAMDHDYQANQLSKSSRIAQDENCFEMASGYGMMHGGLMNESKHDDSRFGLLYPNATDVDASKGSSGQEKQSQKRHLMEGEVQAAKKHGGNVKKTKTKPSSSKDPQSIAAKNRRERISERLKILQDLVPNGNKVDLVTMLEKAISYVKFLQLQVKVLATDEFWPAQGGKAPELGQVKEAIEAILSSHKERNSISKQ